MTKGVATQAAGRARAAHGVMGGWRRERAG